MCVTTLYILIQYAIEIYERKEVKFSRKQPAGRHGQDVPDPAFIAAGTIREMGGSFIGESPDSRIRPWGRQRACIGYLFHARFLGGGFGPAVPGGGLALSPKKPLVRVITVTRGKT